MRLIFRLALVLFPVYSIAQLQDRIWVFGDHGGIDFNDTANVNSFYSGLNGTQVKYSCASIAGQSGQLLFVVASNKLNLQGAQVFDRNYSIMFGGDSLQGHPAQTQGLIILPAPGDTNQYYIFHKTQYNSKNNLYYSIVDMSLNSGLGQVISKNTQIQCDSLTQRTTAVKHANGRDWWLIQQRWDQDEYLKFLITPDGIHGPYKQSTATANPKEEIIGTSCFSRNGDKLVSVGAFGNISLMDFDRCTGNIMNYQQIGPGIAAHAYAYLGCAFSANENVLYVANTFPDGKYVYQYDLTASDIKASEQVVCYYPDTGLLQNIQIAHLLLGPDDKIYVSKGNGSGPNSNTVYTQNMDVILNPDLVGAGCNYRSNYLYLSGGRTTYGLPNMVNYNLGPVVGSICDSLSTGVSETSLAKNPFMVSPNPVRDWITVYPEEDFATGTVINASIFSVEGKLIFEKKLRNGEYSIPASELGIGVYILQLNTDKGVYSERVLKVE